MLSSRTIVLLVTCTIAHAAGAEPPSDALQNTFEQTVRPFLKTHCDTCHGAQRQESKLDLGRFTTSTDVAREFGIWEHVLTRLEAKEMPPEDAKQQPSDASREAVIEWIKRLRQFEATRNAGDPGIVLPRRLSNAEYNYTIRDLTGVDIRPTKEFPVDPANESGFDNSGESLSMSPALLKKYLDAARRVAEHLVLKPHGFDFAPHPVVTDTDRDKYCVKRIVQFYQRQPTDIAAYFFAAWWYKNRERLGQTAGTLDDVAASQRVSAKYLATIWSLLSAEPQQIGPIAEVQRRWRAIPELTAASGPDVESQKNAARRVCESLNDFVTEFRQQLAPTFRNLDIEGSNKGSQPFVLWKNNQYAAYRLRLHPQVLSRWEDGTHNGEPFLLSMPTDENGRSEFTAACERFCAVFPDAFYISERGRDYVGASKDRQEKGRLLSAGFHSMMGYYRDDEPLCELVLNPEQRREIDALWQELDFVTSAPMRQYTGFVWFERTDSRFMRDAEFDFARAEDKDVTSEGKLQRLAQRYLAKARASGGDEDAIESITDYFRLMNEQIRWVEQARQSAEPSHLESLRAFANRAYRRPLTTAERDELIAFYRSLRNDEGVSHEDALQDALVSVLMAPHFCYRMDLAGASAKPRALTDHELANRLSYFLWSTMPDEKLLDVAASGTLRQSETLVAQVKRMLQDQRMREFATEFGGNWLDSRRFDEHNSVDRERFPSFTDSLRQAMFEEPIRFFVDVVERDGSVLDFLYADHTFVNAELASHYGMPAVPVSPNQWYRVEDAQRYGRGGLLPMSVFLTKNAPGLRTSPVKRGYWVIRQLLGERIPPPPPNVPELPNDEGKLGELTLREVMARHREHKSCAGCHDRFDSIGLAFEGFGPIGELRDIDLGGRPVDTLATFPSDESGKGVEGLQRYLANKRQEEYLTNLCRKLLSYAIGRSLILSDESLLADMRRKLEHDDYRFSSLIESIVLSPQFLRKRGE